MQSQYTYSIVIPHYNSPDTLKRMLESIPERDDIQVIVVDDGSSAENKKTLSLLSHRNLEIYYNETNMGGGFSRNAGFSHVKGKWFIGCDADDFFSDDAFDVLDKYKDCEIDYLCYCIKVLNDKTLEPLGLIVRSDASVRRYLAKADKKGVNLFKYRNYEPWNKMIRADFIRKNSIHWENCRINIDVMFSLQLGLCGKKYMAIPDELYNLVFSENSITRKKKNIEREFGFYLQVVKRNAIYRALKLGWPFYRPEWLYLPFLLNKRGVVDTIQFYRYKHNHAEMVHEARTAYLPLLQDVLR